MTTDLRPPRSAFSVFDVACVVTPLSGAPYATKVARVDPKPEDATVVDGPLFSFWNAEAPGIGQGTVFVIDAGSDAGTWKVIRVHRNDGELTEVVATKAAV
jgi:hypothetical protein